jgi:8-oxo-dGTP diphosphatase
VATVDSAFRTSRSLGISVASADSAPVRVVAGLLRRDGRVLLCHRHRRRVKYPDVWDLPGGHIEEGESIADTLVRELAEELGIDVDPPVGPPWVTLHADGIALHVFLVDRWQGEPRNVAVDEHDDISWTGVDGLHLLDLAHPSYMELLRRALT